METVEELWPREDEPALRNWPFDLFRTTDLEDRFAAAGVETVVLVGVATGMAIDVAACRPAARSCDRIIPSDCITDGDRELHDAPVTHVLPVLGLVTAHEVVIAHL